MQITSGRHSELLPLWLGRLILVAPVPDRNKPPVLDRRQLAGADADLTAQLGQLG